jgi:hypothetical protein
MNILPYRIIVNLFLRPGVLDMDGWMDMDFLQPRFWDSILISPSAMGTTSDVARRIIIGTSIDSVVSILPAFIVR